MTSTATSDDLSQAIESAGTPTGALFPWHAGAVYMSAVYGVGTLAYAPYYFFAFLSPLILSRQADRWPNTRGFEQADSVSLHVAASEFGAAGRLMSLASSAPEGCWPTSVDSEIAVLTERSSPRRPFDFPEVRS